MKRLKFIWHWFRRKFGYARLVCLVLLIGIGLLRTTDFEPIEELRIRTFDTYQRFDPRVKTIRPITIADIVINLTNLGARVIAFDVVFSEPDRLNPDIAAKTMRYLDDVTRKRLSELPSNDQ